ncbi:MAG: right-handed parallel beta-helix repeat-containing protein [Chthoniobacteraceae bacterium]
MISKLPFIIALLIALLAGFENTTAGPDAPNASFTSEQKQAQRAAGDKVQADLVAALERGDKTFAIAPGDYRFAKPWPGSSFSTFRFANVSGFTLDGHGARFFFESPTDGPVTGGFVLAGCRDVTIRNLTLDWDPLPFTQGTVTAADEATREIVFKPDAGYDFIFPAMRKDDGKLVRIFVFDKATRKLAPYQMRTGVRPLLAGRGVMEQAEADGTYRMKLTEGPNNAEHVYSPAQQGVPAGSSVVLVHRSGPVSFWLENCGPVNIENVTAHSGPMGFALGRFGEGPLAFRHCKVVRPAGTDRLITLNADCVNVGKMLHGPIVEDGEFEAVCDDFVNIFGLMFPVFAQPTPNELIVGDFTTNGVAQPALRFQTLGTLKMLGDRTAVSMTPIPDYTVPAEWAKGLEIPRPWKPLRSDAAAGGKKVRALRVVIDAALTMPAEGVFFAPLNGICEGAQFRRNQFTTGVARGMLLQSHNAVVEDNRFANLLESTLILGTEAALWAGAVNAKGIVLRGNHIEDTNLRAISHRYSATIELSVEGELSGTDWIEDVRIEGNTIVRPGGSAIAIHGARRVRITGNTFVECGNLPWHGLGRQAEKYGVPVAVYAGEEIEQKDNKAVRTGPYSLEQ